MKILVTGGAGFIGSHLVDELLSRGNEVIALDNFVNGKEDNLKSAEKSTNFQFVKGDILDVETCKKVSKGIDVVYHLACLGVRHSIHSPFENHRVNAEGTLNVLQAARENGVKKFFYISTSEIYGRTDSFPINEKSITQPLTVYGSSKLAGEHYTNSYHECYGLDTTVLRIFNNYGPRAHYEGDAGEIIPRSIVNILYGKSPIVFGDGLITRDFFFVKDTAIVLSDLMNYNNLTAKTFNLGTGVEITMKHLLETILNKMPEHKSNIDYMPDRPADVPRLWVDSSKFRSVVKIENEIHFEQGIEQTIAFYKELMKSKDLLKEIKIKNWE